VIAPKSSAATIQIISTCLVTEKSIPKIVGRWINGCDSALFETCPMISSPGLNGSAAAPLAVGTTCS
jgi:hypothetical protein